MTILILGYFYPKHGSSELQVKHPKNLGCFYQLVFTVEIQRKAQNQFTNQMISGQHQGRQKKYFYKFLSLVFLYCFQAEGYWVFLAKLPSTSLILLYHFWAHVTS